MRPGRFTALGCRVVGVEAWEADTAVVFGRHTHEQFGVGLIERGAQRSASGRGTVEAGVGDVITVNPGEVHDGAPIGGAGRRWRMLYLEPAVVSELVDDIVDGSTAPGFEFTLPAIRDERATGLFGSLFQAMTHRGAADGFQVDEALLLFFAGWLKPIVRHPRPVPPGIASARSMIDDDPAATLTLAGLAHEAGLGRHHFLRCFARATGLTPHAYLMQRRLHRARRLIGRGVGLAEAAASSGFADQSHMTRLFGRSFGLSPGAYARAIGRQDGNFVQDRSTSVGEDRSP